MVKVKNSQSRSSFPFLCGHFFRFTVVPETTEDTKGDTETEGESSEKKPEDELKKEYEDDDAG